LGVLGVLASLNVHLRTHLLRQAIFSQTLDLPRADGMLAAVVMVVVHIL
jgi:hypothetical protein